MKSSKKIYQRLTGTFLFAIMFFIASYTYALTSGETYTIVLSKMNSNGTVSDVASTTAIANSEGKITFSLSGVPTSPNTFFLILTVKDSSSTTVRKSFVPAPPAGGTGQLGINNLSTAQTNMILQALSGAGTDDPIVVAYGLILTRSPNLSSTDLTNIATLGKTAIMNGFETFLTSNGVSSSQLQTFKEKLIYNQPNKDLSNFTQLFKSAVDNPGQAADEMAKAAGLISDIFMDAAVASGIDLGLVQAAHDAAGDVVQSDPDASAAFNGFDATTRTVIDQAMSNFFRRIAVMKVKTDYSNALNSLGATGSQITRFSTALDDLTVNLQSIDTDYTMYFEDPQNNDITAQSTNTAFLAAAAANPQQFPATTIQEEMNWRYGQVFNSFINDIRITNSEADDMRTAVVNGLVVFTGQSQGVIDAMVPSNMGKDWFDFNGNTVNWPIPMAVAFKTVGIYLQNGGNFTYLRQGLSVPGNMAQWLDSDDNYSNGVDGQPHDFQSMGLPAPFAALMGMQEDVKIMDHTRFYLWDNNNVATNGQPTKDQEKTAKLAFVQGLENVAADIGGTTNGSTALTLTIKKAFVKMMQEPTIY